MKKFTKKEIIIIFIIVIIASILVINGINAYKSYKNHKLTTAYESQISNIYKGFIKEKDDNKKINSLKELLKDFNEYKKSNNYLKDVNKDYEDKINKIKKYFTKEYDTQINKNTLANIDKINDINIFDNAKTNLQNEIKIIDKNGTVVCDKKQIDNYYNNINKLITSYDSRIKTIQEKEAAKAAADAKAKADAEAAAKVVQASQNSAKTSSSSNNDNNSTSASKSSKSSGSSSGSSSTTKSSGSSTGTGSSGNGRYITGYTWQTDSNGNEIPGTKITHYSDGTSTNEQGQTFNLFDN